MAGERSRCGAKTRAGGKCQAPAMSNGKCRVHGGQSLPPGPGHPRWQHGNYSVLLGQRKAGLAELYRAAEQDPDLASMRRELALVDVLLHEAVEEYGDRGGLPWEELRRQKVILVSAREAGDAPAILSALNGLLALIDRGSEAADALARIGTLVEQRRRVAESEQKREHTTRNMVTAAQAMGLLMRVAESIRTHVTDPEARAAITRDISVLLGPGQLPPEEIAVEQEQERESAG